MCALALRGSLPLCLVSTVLVSANMSALASIWMRSSQSHSGALAGVYMYHVAVAVTVCVHGLLWFSLRLGVYGVRSRPLYSKTEYWAVFVCIYVCLTGMRCMKCVYQ